MTKGLSLNVYTQANAGMLKNSEKATYTNLGASAGFNVNANFDGKNSLIYGAEVGAGTAVTAKAEIGYKRALSKNSNLVFTGNFSYDKSLTRTDNYNVHIDNNAEINGKKYQLDLVDKKYDWNPDNLQYGGRVGYNKETKWGGYEVGAEVAYRTNSSPEFHKTTGSKSEFSCSGKKVEIATHDEYGRDRKEGVFATPYGKIHANLTANGALQAIGEANSRELKVGLRYSIFKK